MTSFDATIARDAAQARVLDLDVDHHARVIGAPGSGKTLLLVESVARVLSQDGWVAGDVLAIAPNRLVAARLRAQIERRVQRVMGSTPARTASSFAFSVLDGHAAQQGETPPRLLTGTVHDESIAEVVRARLETFASVDPSAWPSLAPEVLLSAPFRAELRELARVLDDFGLEPQELQSQLRMLERESRSEAFTSAPDPELLARWDEGASLLATVDAALRVERPDEVSSSGMLRAAAALIRSGEVRPPRLLLVDDAQELGEGQLALLAACASAGSTIWVFGDPDISTGAFQGERTRVLAGLSVELSRRGWEAPPTHTEQVVVLDHVYRHGAAIREIVQGLSGKLGARGTAEHRAVTAAPQAGGAAGGAEPATAQSVQFAKAPSASAQVGIIAHRMRARKLGLGDASAQLSWNEMAVVCRSRAEATRMARLLAAHQVPAGIAAGGVVLREHQIVRELIALLQHALGFHELDASEVLSLAGGVMGGLDAVAIRRLRGALLIAERRSARSEDRDPRPLDAIIGEAFQFPGTAPVLDSAGGRAIRRLGLIAAAGTRVCAAGGTPREVLWALWEGTRFAERWQQEAISGRSAAADDAHRSLDAVLGLFFALQRHEEQASEQPIEALLDDILGSTVPEDSLAQRSSQDVVTVTTPQGMIGREFPLVVVIGAQDGAWPNLRARGSLLGTAALERWLRGGVAQAPSRRDTIHDELRLFVQACSRANDELLVVAIADDEQHPSPFFGFGKDFEVSQLPHARLTLRGVTASHRRIVVLDPTDTAAVHALARLAAAHVPGADPDDWYGIRGPSSDTALFTEATGEEDRGIPVSPSQLERAEECALDWVISALGAGSGSVQASLGTLVHHALETAVSTDAESLLATIHAEWNKLPFDAAWESERMQRLAERMAEGLSEYLREFEASDRDLLGRESRFSLRIGRAELRGVADRLEHRLTEDGWEVTVVDLKTGRGAASKPAAEAHVQLQAYQLGAALGAFEVADAEHAAGTLHTAAKLLYVHPDATNGNGFVERTQAELDDDGKAALVQRVTDIAEVMAAGEFTARVEHHCSDPHKPGNCRLHIIQAVSHA